MKHIRGGLVGGYVLARGEDMCIFFPRLLAEDPDVERQLQNLESRGMTIVSRLGPNDIVEAEYSFESVIRERARTEMLL